MELPTPENKTLDVVDGILKGIIHGVGVNAAIAAITVRFPFLGYPIIKDILRWVVSNVADDIFGAIAPYVDYQIIHFQNEEQRKTYEAAVCALRDAQKKGDADEKQKAIDRTKAALDKLISFKH